MYAGGGEAADQTVRLMLAGCETAVRLGGSGLKNVLALSLALAKNNKQISGKVNLGKMLRETRDLRLFPMTNEQYRQFAKMAKPQKLLYSVIRDKDSGEIEVVLPVTELERANLIFEKMLYNLPEQKPAEPAVEAAEPESEIEPQQEPMEQEQTEREVEAAQPEPLEPEQVEPPENIQRSQTEKSEQMVIPLQPESKRENDPKKESRLASDLNATKPSSSIWKESGNIIQTISEQAERPSIEARLKEFQAQIDLAKGLEPTRNKVRNKERAR